MLDLTRDPCGENVSETDPRRTGQGLDDDSTRDASNLARAGRENHRFNPQSHKSSMRGRSFAHRSKIVAWEAYD